jgi:hypothetical protein
VTGKWPDERIAGQIEIGSLGASVMGWGIDVAGLGYCHTCILYWFGKIYGRATAQLGPNVALPMLAGTRVHTAERKEAHTCRREALKMPRRHNAHVSILL